MLRLFFSRLFMTTGKVIRKCYSALFFFIAWHTSIKQKMEICYPELNKDLFMDNYDFDQLLSKLGSLKWISDKWKGILDFEYRYPAILFAGEICNEYGRDCDDFAMAWYSILKRRPEWEQVIMVLCADGFSIKRSHFVTVAKRKGTSFWYLFSNYTASASLDYSTWQKAVEEQKVPDNRVRIYYPSLIYIIYNRYIRRY